MEDEIKYKEFLDKVKVLLDEYNVFILNLSGVYTDDGLEKELDKPIPKRIFKMISSVFVEDAITKIDLDNSSDRENELMLFSGLALRQLGESQVGIGQMMMKDGVAAVVTAEKNLGMDTAKLHTLEANAEYIIFTKNAKLSLIYNDDLEFTVTKLEGEIDVPKPPLTFIGNVQSDGEIFRAEGLPIISTKCKALFGRGEYPIFVTSEVSGVFKRSDLN